MNDRHPSGTAHAPASAPDAASAAHGSHNLGGEQGNYPGYDGYGTYATTGFDADPLFGDMPGSGGAYESGSWSTVQAPSHGVTDSGQYAAPYAAPQDAYGTGGYDTSGGWAAQQEPAPTGQPGTDATGQWQTAPFDPQNPQHSQNPQHFDAQNFDPGAFAPQSEQFGTQGFDTPGYPAGAYEPAPNADGWQQPDYGTGQFTTLDPTAQGYATPGYDAQGGQAVHGVQGVQGFDQPAFDTPGFETPGFETPAFEPPGFGTAGFAGGDQAVHGYAVQDYPHTAPTTTALDGHESLGAHAYDATGGAAQGLAPSVPAQGYAAHPEAAGTAYDATDPLNPTGSYETTGFDTATFEAIYEAPAYPEEPRYATGGFAVVDGEEARGGADQDGGAAGVPLPPVPAPGHDRGDRHDRDELPSQEPDFAGAVELPEVAAEHPDDQPFAPAARGRARRRTGPKRSALLSVAVPSACVMGVAGIAAASVGDFGDGGKEEAKASAPDPTSVQPSVANSRLDTQLQGVTDATGDFADRASRTQERIDLKAKQEADRKRAAEEAARKERLRPKFSLPVQRHGLSAYYGQSGVNWMSVHTGIDFPVAYGTPVLAATDGTVRTQYNTAYGNMAIVTAKDGTETWYCHLSSHKLFSGEVKAGDVIAFSGNSGNSTGPHLHFEVRPGGGSAVNPLPWLQSHGLDPQ